MREIKFRAWDKKHSYMDDEFWIDSRGNIYDRARITYDTPNTEVEQAKDDRFILMQYTGLNDINGVEIYEGDIVTATWYDDIVIMQLSLTGKVQYHSGWLAFVIWDEQRKTMSEINGCGFRDWEIEVIGNIYESPELLEGGGE